VLANGLFVPNDPYGKRSTLPVLATANKSPEYFCVIPRADVGKEPFTATAVAPSALPGNATFAHISPIRRTPAADQRIERIMDPTTLENLPIVITRTLRTVNKCFLPDRFVV
jgi:hypothetical protein